jgi:uncharacterized protein YndB with AHSA1/START domain
MITAQANVIINASIDQVWEALTNPTIIKQYFFGTQTETTWKIGHPIKFSGEWNGNKYEDKGTIIDVEPGKTIKYTYWSSISGMEDLPQNYVTITYTLSSSNNHTSLNILQENIPDETMKEHAEANWKLVLNSLKNLLEEKNNVPAF